CLLAKLQSSRAEKLEIKSPIPARIVLFGDLLIISMSTMIPIGGLVPMLLTPCSVWTTETGDDMPSFDRTVGRAKKGLFNLYAQNLVMSNTFPPPVRSEERRVGKDGSFI